MEFIRSATAALELRLRHARGNVTNGRSKTRKTGRTSRGLDFASILPKKKGRLTRRNCAAKAEKCKARGTQIPLSAICRIEGLPSIQGINEATTEWGTSGDIDTAKNAAAD
jgi:hypothetical protein